MLILKIAMTSVLISIVGAVGSCQMRTSSPTSYPSPSQA